MISTQATRRCATRTRSSLAYVSRQTCVDSKASTRLQCARTRTVWTQLFGRASRTRREQSIRPKISRIDFDLTELESSEVWWGPPKPVVGIHTGESRAALEPRPRRRQVARLHAPAGRRGPAAPRAESGPPRPRRRAPRLRSGRARPRRAPRAPAPPLLRLGRAPGFFYVFTRRMHRRGIGSLSASPRPGRRASPRGS